MGIAALDPSYAGYWRERNQEADFVLKSDPAVAAIEVKSGRSRDALSGMSAFAAAFRPRAKLLVGGQGIPLEEFLLRPAAEWVGA